MRSALAWSAAAPLLAGFCLLDSATGRLPGLRAAQPDPARPDFNVSVDLVTLDVIPLRDGRFVPDLIAEDFEVLEEDVAQQVASLVLVHGGRVFNLKRPPEPAAPPAPEGIVLPSARADASAPGRIFVLIIDDLHFTAAETPLVRALLRRIASTLIHPGDMFAVFSTGPSSIEIPPTYDHARLEAAIGKAAGHGMSYQDVMDARDGSQGPQGLRQNTHVAFSTVHGLIGSLEQVRDRRKAIILVSTGYDFDPFPQGRAGTDQVFGGRYGTPWADAERGDRFLALEKEHNRFADADLAAELVALTGAANRVNAAIYALDPRGLAGVTSAADPADLGERRTHLSKTQNSLRVLAEATGGTAVVNDNDFDRALKRIDAETSDYYVLGYYSSTRDPGRRNRSVAVRVRQPGIEVRSRTWYLARPAASGPSGPPR